MNPAPVTANFRVLSFHELQLEWESAIRRITEADNNAFCSGLNREEVIACVRAMECIAGISPLSLLEQIGKSAAASWAFSPSCSMGLLEWLPILIVIHCSLVVVLNLKETVLDSEIIMALPQFDQDL